MFAFTGRARPCNRRKGAIRRWIVAGALSLAAASQLLAHDYTAGTLTIAHPWARETAAGQPAGGGFMTIANRGSGADRLIGGTSPMAAEVQIHTMTVQGGVMRMRPLPDGLEIPAGRQVTLRPGGYHLMLTGLKQPMRQEARVPVTLRFQRAGNVRVELTVEPISAAAPGEGHHG